MKTPHKNLIQMLKAKKRIKNNMGSTATKSIKDR
jgi:hypothetical protein